MEQKSNYRGIYLSIIVIAFIFLTKIFLTVVSPVKDTAIIYRPNYLVGDTLNLSYDQVVDSGGVNDDVWESDNVLVSKTLEGTNVEDYFDITLQVKTKKPVTEYLENEAVAIVIVMDLSNTMNSAIDGSSTSAYENSKAYKAVAAAQSFAQQFYNGSKDYPNNVIGAVGFNTSGISLANMTNLNTQAKVDSFNSTLYNGVYGVVRGRGYNASPERFTNIEAGLKMARTMLSNCPQKHKFIIFLSDGLPTTYTVGTGATDYIGIYTDTLNDGLNNRTLAAGNYSDTGARRAREVAMDIKSQGITIYSIGVGLSTFKGYENANVPYGSNPTKLNGEKFIMNEIGRQIVTTGSTVENDFDKITYLTGNNWRVRTWNAKKGEILGLDWEIKNNFDPATMGTTPKYELSENPPDGQPNLFENWLKYGIGSGYYYDVDNNNALSDALDDIYSQLNTNILSKRTTLWTTTDPMYDQTYSLKEYIEFIGFFDSSGNLAQSLTRSNVEKNTASLDKSKILDGEINWDLKNSDYEIVRENNEDLYVYTLKYRIRLKTDKEGFIKETPYDTNGKTTLTYVVEEDGNVSDIKTIDYPIPKVKGYLVDIKIKKTVEGLAQGFTFTTQNSNFEFTVNFLRCKEEFTNKFTYDKYDSEDNIIESNQEIQSGDTFTLQDGEYIIIHNLFHGINWTVTETAKDGFVSTITSGSSSGVITSNQSLSEVTGVTYNNKAYQLKMRKVDSVTGNPLDGVRFSLYATYENGVFSNIVTNMNGILLKDLLTVDGIIDFGNLAFDVNQTTTYYLVEEDTIDKYNLLDNYVEIKVSADGIVASYNGSNIQTQQVGNSFEVVVPNAKGIDLPETGSNGKLIFTILGILLILLSGILNIGKEGNLFMKKIFNLVFTFLIAFLVYGNVNADTTYKIEIKEASEGHTYEAYQIFKGDLSIDKKTLSNIKWGSGVSATFIEGKNANDYANSITNANAKEKAIELGANLSTTVAGSTSTISNGTYTISGLEPGYYLVKDKNGTQANNYDAYTEYIVKLVGDTEVKPKTGKPTADKKILEGTNETEVVYSSNYAVGDEVKYILKGTLPANYDNYTTYKYIFHDKFSDGLTLKDGSVEVYVDGVKITSGFTVDPNPTDGDSLDVIFNDTKLVTSITATSEITVKYIAIVNDDAVRGLPGNDNTLNIEFSNNPYTNETGKTNNIITKVYVFDFIFNKVDSKTKNALKGAGFTLEKYVDNKWVEVETIVNTTGNEFTFEGLSVGRYRLTETTTPDGYNTISPVTFDVTATYDDNGLASLSGTEFSFTADLNAGTLTTDVENVKGVELPLTGGSGTVIFTLIGLSLIGIAVISLFKNKEEK